MSDDTGLLVGQIADLIEQLARLPVDSAEDLLNEVTDALADADADRAGLHEVAIDGLRWGLRAAVTVHLAGGAMLRLVEPGMTLTVEWDSAGDARPQIKAALAALEGARVTATGVGEGDE